MKKYTLLTITVISFLILPPLYFISEGMTAVEATKQVSRDSYEVFQTNTMKNFWDAVRTYAWIIPASLAILTAYQFKKENKQ